MHAATKAMEYANREAFDTDRVKYEEEIASLRRIIDGESMIHQCPHLDTDQYRGTQSVCERKRSSITWKWD